MDIDETIAWLESKAKEGRLSADIAMHPDDDRECRDYADKTEEAANHLRRLRDASKDICDNAVEGEMFESASMADGVTWKQVERLRAALNEVAK